MITNAESGTNVNEIADGIYRINTPLSLVPGGFSFNQYLVVDDEPLLFHTGLKRTFPLVREAIERVMPVERLRYIAFSHFEADECGALNPLLAAAPRAVAVCSQVAAHGLRRGLRGPRAPAARRRRNAAARKTHASAGSTRRTCRTAGRPGSSSRRPRARCSAATSSRRAAPGDAPVTESDILGPSEAFRQAMDYYSHSKNAGPILEAPRGDRADARSPCMHGSAWRGDGGGLLRELAPLSRRLSLADALSARRSGFRACRSARPAGRAGTRPPATRAPRARAATATARRTRPAGTPAVHDRADGDDARRRRPRRAADDLARRLARS